ncbi:MAG: Rpn family recombination-promoting nuclease/putative transposase, partial [Candidatus Riflebacteria bacterium]|nr:Rpn family recombination-promoting nuclease/putative transposase [Candidatus Riflebacteria bacterium]
QQDIAHKECYSHPENVNDLIQGFVAVDCVEQFDLSTLERDNASYTEKEKNERHDDIVWRLKWRDEWVYIYIIIEFQSDEDETMPVRIMSYLSLLYLNLLANKNLGYGVKKKLPIVLPIVLYNGKYDWNVTKNIQDIIEDTQDNSLQKYIPKLSYYLIDEIRPNANEKDSVFTGLTNSVIATMKLQRAVSREDFNKLTEELKVIFKDEKQKHRFGSFITFMLRLLSIKLDNNDYEKAKNLDEVIKMTYTFIDREIENGEKKGKISAFYDMIKKGLITLEQAANSLGISPKQLLDNFKEYNLVL